MKQLLAAALLAAVASPALADRPSDATLFQLYARARVADAEGDFRAAAAGYSAALAARPDDAVLAARAFRQAISAGERDLALRSGALLDAKGLLPPDGTLLLVTQAVTERNWAKARTLTDRVAKENAFGFLAPALRAWIALGAKEHDPAAYLDSADGGPLAKAYAPEQRALLALARKKYDDAITGVRALAVSSDGAPVRLRLAAAATLSARGKRDRALELLTGDDPAIVAARALVTARQPLPGAIDTPAAGIAELFSRVAVDINRERVTPLALTLARLATFLDADNADGWLTTSELLAALGSYDPAIDALDRIAANDPYHDLAAQARVELLVRKGEQKEALAEAERITRAPDASVADWRRLGDRYLDLDRYAESADAFAHALALAEKDPASIPQRWLIQLQYGAALDKLNRWTEAKAALQQAAAEAPDEPVALNFLGYVQLERRENLQEAAALIARASQLRPDDAAITDSLGWAYYLRGDLPKAIETLEKAVVGDPGEATANEHLGDAYWTVGRRLEARYAWRAALVHAEDKAVARLQAKLTDGLSQVTAAP